MQTKVIMVEKEDKKKLYLILFLYIFQFTLFSYYTAYLFFPSEKINLNKSIFVEVDTNYNFNLTYLKSQAESVFQDIGVNSTFLFTQQLNTSQIEFSYENVSDFAYLSNNTKNFNNSVHLLVVDSIIVNNIDYYYGYAARSSLWFNAFNQSNSLNASYTSGVIAAGTIMNDTNNDQILLKVILHELGHLLGCGHSSNGIMKTGQHLELYFSAESIFQMNFEQIWTRDIGFGVYR
ncbi:MAG: hypothetical protein ACTSYF_01035 [Promethearchaeota archaeon]